jgi:hypothetical protein
MRRTLTRGIDQGRTMNGRELITASMREPDRLRVIKAVVASKPTVLQE